MNNPTLSRFTFDIVAKKKRKEEQRRFKMDSKMNKNTFQFPVNKNSFIFKLYMNLMRSLHQFSMKNYSWYLITRNESLNAIIQILITICVLLLCCSKYSIQIIFLLMMT